MSFNDPKILAVAETYRKMCATLSLIEELHPEIKSILNDDHTHSREKFDKVRDKVLELKERGEKTGFADDEARKGSSRKVLLNEDPTEIKLDVPTIQQKSRKILKNLIHNYAAFDISTIDKFNVSTTNINGAVVIANGTLSQNTTTLTNSLISPTQVTHYVNGTSNGSSNYTEIFETGVSYLGFDNYLGDNCFNGTMYEVLIYSNVLADSDRYKIEAYLYQKWAFNLDPTNPYKISGYSNYNYPLINSNNFIGTKSFTFTGSIDSNSYTLIKNYYTKLTNTLSNAPFP